MKTILLSGVHGVGKGYFLDKVRKCIRNYDVYSASQLIEKYHSAADAGYKRVSNISNNQHVLIQAIRKEQIQNTQNLIIDGHICLFNASGLVERIPEYFFSETGIAGIILLQDTSANICDRILQRDSRRININDIEEMQREERIYALELQKKYGIQCMTITHNCTGRQFAEILERMGEQ